jgi:hypothetical protein
MRGKHNAAARTRKGIAKVRKSLCPIHETRTPCGVCHAERIKQQQFQNFVHSRR